MGSKSKGFQTLSEWRREGLMLKQKQIARDLRTSQGQVSKVENGHLPTPWERQRWADAYRLPVEEFTRMVQQAAALASIQQPSDMPLFSQPTGQRCDVITIKTQSDDDRKAANA